MKIDVLKSMKKMPEYMEAFTNFFLGAFIGVTIVGAVAYQTISGAINVPTVITTWLNTTVTTLSTQGTALVAVVTTIISLIIIGVLMTLFGKGGKTGKSS